MSTGNRTGIEPKTRAGLDTIIGERDTPKLMAESFVVYHGNDIAYAGGVSVDRKTVYIDQWLYEQIVSGKVKVRGLSPKQVIGRIIDHEHTEKAVDDGDNACDIYQPAHAFALRKENDGVDDIAGQGAAARYETDIKPALAECQRRFLKLGRRADPPRKASKFSVHYGLGKEECRRCAMFGERGDYGSPDLRKCEKVCGLVRAGRYCDKWTAE